MGVITSNNETVKNNDRAHNKVNMLLTREGVNTV